MCVTAQLAIDKPYERTECDFKHADTNDLYRVHISLIRS